MRQPDRPRRQQRHPDGLPDGVIALPLVRDRASDVLAEAIDSTTPSLAQRLAFKCPYNFNVIRLGEAGEEVRWNRLEDYVREPWLTDGAGHEVSIRLFGQFSPTHSEHIRDKALIEAP